MFEDWFLLVAFNLSVLTYYLGVLVYALPVPWYGVKKWGPLLIIDGIFSATLVFGFNLIVQAINYIFTILGLSWNNLMLWLNTVISSIFVLIFFIQLLGSMLSKLSLGLIPNFLGPLYSILSYSLTSLFLIQFIALIVRLHYTKLIALGIMLFAMPFRIARTAGAVLVSFSIVFYIGLPLLPVFVQTLSQPQEFNQETYIYGVSFPHYLVKSYNGSSIPMAVMNIYSVNNSLLARYITDNNGSIYASYPDKGSPSNYFKIEIEYFGYAFKTYPYKFINNFTCSHASNHTGENTTCLFNVHVPGILYASTCMVLFNVWNASVKDFSVVGLDKVQLLINVSKQGVYEIMVWRGSKDDIGVLLNGTLLAHDKIIIDNVEWYGNNLNILKARLDAGIWNISILLGGNCQQIYLDKKSLEIYYIKHTMNASNILSFVEQSSSYYFFSTIILTSSYIILLTIISYGLAIFLGGRYPRIPLRVF